MNDALSVHAETGKSGRERHIDKRALPTTRLQYADASETPTAQSAPSVSAFFCATVFYKRKNPPRFSLFFPEFFPSFFKFAFAVRIISVVV